MHGVAMMVDGYCLECGEQPPGWNDTSIPLNVDVLRRLGRYVAGGGLFFILACVQRPGMPRAFWLIGATALWLHPVDRGRPPGILRHIHPGLPLRRAGQGQECPVVRRRCPELAR